MTWTTEPQAEQATTKAANNNIFLYFRISGVRRSKQRVFRRTPETFFSPHRFLIPQNHLVTDHLTMRKPKRRFGETNRRLRKFFRRFILSKRHSDARVQKEAVCSLYLLIRNRRLGNMNLTMSSNYSFIACIGCEAWLTRAAKRGLLSIFPLMFVMPVRCAME